MGFVLFPSLWAPGSMSEGWGRDLGTGTQLFFIGLMAMFI